jgi:hypothetical protein
MLTVPGHEILRVVIVHSRLKSSLDSSVTYHIHVAPDASALATRYFFGHGYPLRAHPSLRAVEGQAATSARGK